MEAGHDPAHFDFFVGTGSPGIVSAEDVRTAWTLVAVRGVLAFTATGFAFTTAAFHWAASPKRFPDLGPKHTAQRLFYNTTNFFFPGRPSPLPAPWTVTLDVSRVVQRKFEAFRAHTSQLPLMEKFQSFFEKRASQEFYTLAATPKPQAAIQTNDLFAGL